MKGIIEMAEEKADEEYKKYLEAVKTRKEKQYEELKQVYHSLSKGKKVIDVFDAFEKTGVNDLGEPKLAICKADAKTVYFSKERIGSGHFSHQSFDWSKRLIVDDVLLPSGTFPEWKENEKRFFIRPKIKTGVPLIPAHLLPNGKLENYHILWQVKDWQETIPPKKDPFLLKRISNNLFTVLAEWDVTEVERAVLRGYQ